MKEYLSASTKPILICGPCSAESHQQVLQTAKDVKEAGVTWFRAGIWKPRTRPNSFEGIGEVGLQWLKEVQQTLSLKVCTEVAKPFHVEECLKAGINAVWIGARTCSNPFSVQEIAESLKGVDNLSVLIKNPTTPDIHLWLGAIERIEKTGVKDIVAVHRGFALENNSSYRQTPLWRIPIELQRLRRDIKIICDPSHIAGKREYVKEIALSAASIGFAGLMIETHNNPLQAKTDNNQQLFSKDLKEFLSSINFPNNKEVNSNELEAYRQEINDIDKNICNLLSERMNLSKQIAEIKIAKNMTVFQPNRWQEVMDSIISISKKQGLNEDFIEEIYNIIHQESIKTQESIVNKKEVMS